MWRLVLFLPCLLTTSSISLPDLSKYQYTSISDAYSAQTALLAEYSLIRASSWKLFNYQLYQESVVIKNEILRGFLKIFRKSCSVSINKATGKLEIPIEYLNVVIDSLEIRSHKLSLSLLFEVVIKKAKWLPIVREKAYSIYAEEWVLAAAYQGSITCLELFDSNLPSIIHDAIDAACSGGSFSAVLHLIKVAIKHGQSEAGRTAYHFALQKAVKYDQSTLLASMIKSPIFLFDIPPSLIQVLVRTAVIRGRLMALEFLVNFYGRYGKEIQNPSIGISLVESAGNGNIEVINYLYCGGDSCLPDRSYLNAINVNIPLMILAAIRGGQLVTVKYFLSPEDVGFLEGDHKLLQSGIHMERLFIQVAIESNQSKILALLLKLGMKPTWEQFIMAVKGGNLLMVKLLLQPRKDGNLLFPHLRPSRDRQLPLLTALQNGHLSIVEFLLRYRLNGRQGFEGVDPLKSAKVVELILRNRKFATLFLRPEFSSLSYWSKLTRICKNTIE